MKAIVLMSGGLDSSLAAKVILEQGVDVIGLTFINPFSQCDHSQECKCAVKKICRQLNIEFKVINLADEFLDIVKNPTYGYGSNINPCIDCKILMLKKAKVLMQEIGASFLATGEVVGQRPMSQKTPTLRLIEKQAGVEGILVRPLSARILEPTQPEKSGWIKRDKLLSISGRGRKDQIALAEKFNIKDYTAPAGGCLLTNEGYSKKVEDLIKHDIFNVQNIGLLKIGRHFRIDAHCKLIVGRNEKENQKLLNMAVEGDIIFEPTEEIAGPAALGRGDNWNEEKTYQCCRTIARYCDKINKEFKIVVKHPHLTSLRIISCLPFEDSMVSIFRI